MKEPLLSISEEKIMNRFVGFIKRHHKLVKNFAIIETYCAYRIFYYVFERFILVFTFNDDKDNVRIRVVKGSHIECYDNTPCIFYNMYHVKYKYFHIEKPSDNTTKTNKS